MVFRGVRPPLRIDLFTVTAGGIFKGEDFNVMGFPGRHRGPDCFGYVFQEHDRRPFLNDRATALGVPNG
ncbi:MAG: ribonuclease Z, partial [Anaerolineae bacterium]|nr:ribonuclease Z [Anaerolineae bacterium]